MGKWVWVLMRVDLRAGLVRFTAFPEGDVRDAEAYKGAIEKLPKGSIVISESSVDVHMHNRRTLRPMTSPAHPSLHARLDSLPDRQVRART
jgi:hypothetical protein